MTPEQRAEQIRTLVKEWLQRGDDRMPEELKQLIEHPVYAKRLQVRRRMSRRFLERYKEGSLTLHFHFGRLRQHALADPAQYCAVAQFVVPDDALEHNYVAPVPNQVNVGRNSGHEIEGAVLIDVVELVQESKRILPTAIRLQSLDRCARLNGNPVEAMSSHFAHEGLGAGADRKHVSVAGNMGRIGQNELPDEMIQCGSKVIEAVADERAQARRRLGQVESEPEVLRIRVLLKTGLAHAAFEFPEDRQYVVKMLLCPDGFLSYAE